MKDPRVIVHRALITEKGALLREQANHYLFEVAINANKIEIARAIEEIFDVHVKQVRTLIRMGKRKRLGRFEGHRANWKRAIVTLRDGETINLFDQV